MGSRNQIAGMTQNINLGLKKNRSTALTDIMRRGRGISESINSGLDDEYVRKDGSLEQVGTRPHSQLTAIGTYTHDEIDAAIETIVTQVAGTYTPVLTNVANLAASTAYSCQYVRLGNTVIVSGRVDVDPTLTATATQLGISLPVASNLANANECGGVAFASAIAGQGAAIIGDATNNRAEMNWIAGDVSNQPMYFTFVYRII